MLIHGTVSELAQLGQLPSEDSAAPEVIKRHEMLIRPLDVPVSDEEACVLVNNFGHDDCFDRARALLKHGYVIDRGSETASLTALGTLGSITKILNPAEVEGLSDSEIIEIHLEELRASLLAGRLIAD